jgi:hypothetical protein
MSMDLTPEDLRIIADKVDVIRKHDLQVVTFDVRNHRVWLARTDDQSDGADYKIKGITDKVSSTLRGSE